jgi:hypothetical protein
MYAANTTTTTAATLEEKLDAAISKSPQLPPEWVEKAANELNERPETVQESLCALRSMVIGTVKQTPWPSVRKRTIPTERPPFVGEI